MAPSKFSDFEILAILRQAQAGGDVAEVCAINGISVATFYRWQKAYGHLLQAGRPEPPCGQA
ncbi:transposase [Pelagibius sp. Alg239-R121]|uniref:transposase n=1 Tax=Pelagibius sp. Alg239-R121 TaxID=2993448 RepID=UPI0024A68F48|nr:transposase [Pelagibius sp. Alg239-R121]